MWLTLFVLFAIVPLQSSDFWDYGRNTHRYKPWSNDINDVDGEGNAGQEPQRCSARPNAVRCYHLFHKIHTLDENIEDEEDHWAWFKHTFEKRFRQKEDKRRRKIFSKNRKFIMDHNKDYESGRNSFKLKLNKYADWYDRELKFLTRLETDSEPSNEEQMVGDMNVEHVSGPWGNDTLLGRSMEIGDDGLPTHIDWREHGYVTPVGEQGRCGCCYAFAGLAALEGQIKRKTGKLVKLSEQNVADCAWGHCKGCHGGSLHCAFQYIRDNHGVDKYSSYPFIGTASRHCEYTRKDKAGDVSSYKYLPRGDEQKLKEAVAKIGPIAVAVSARGSKFLYYHHGIYKDPECAKSVNHAVTIVGYGTDPEEGDYWIIKNSWGKTWGMDGYMLLARNHGNLCAIGGGSFPGN